LYGNNTHSVNFRLPFLLALPWRSTTEAHMSGNRRKFLIAAGGAGLALVGVGGVVVATRRPSRGLRAWAQAETTTSDVRLDAFRRAILAPNPHNRQPWQIRLVGDDTAIITCDLERRLPQTDPFDRQITIGFGCFLELARIAAAERGYQMDMTVFPDGEPQPRLNSTPIARLKFVADASVPKDPLFGAIVRRRSSKVAFEQQRSVDPAVLAGLTNVGIAGAMSQATSDPALVSDLRSLTWRAWMIEAGTARTWMESIDLMRIGRAEIEANPDGIALGGAIMEALAVTGQVTRAKLADPNASAFKMGVDRYRSMLERTSSYLWISTPANTRADQVAAGRAYVRMNLAATAGGIAVHPVSQALQEFPEMAGELDDLHRRLGIAAPARVQMLARIGYAAAVEPTVRWPLDAKVLGSSA
jgi:nitroreductase